LGQERPIPIGVVFYVMLDVYSRYVVGWMIAHRESASLADTLIRRGARRTSSMT